jgi:hypothetical protein
MSSWIKIFWIADMSIESSESACTTELKPSLKFPKRPLLSKQAFFVGISFHIGIVYMIIVFLGS